MSEKQLGQLVKQRTPEGPYEAGIVSLSGTLLFPCCGESWSVTHDRITHVQCPDCGMLYTIALKLSVNPPIPQKFPKGTKMKVTKGFTSKVGAIEVTTIEGEEYRVGLDAYGVFSLSVESIILEFPSQGRNGGRILLAVAPLSHLQLVEETHVKASDSGTNQNSSEDHG